MSAAPLPSRPAGPTLRWPFYILGLISGLILALVVGLVAAGPLVLTHRSELPLERTFGRIAVSLAARLNAGSEANPVAGDQRAIGIGRAAYAGSCGICHGASGDGKGLFGQAAYPPATDLTAAETREKSDAELFWIIKNGLSFVGMPSFAAMYNDRDIWGIVAYVKTLGWGRPAQVVPRPTAEQLAVADPMGDGVQRGAAIYFAMNCMSCHGAVGEAPGDLSLQRSTSVEEAVRDGRRGMPVFDEWLLPDAELAALSAYVETFASGGGQRRGN